MSTTWVLAEAHNGKTLPVVLEIVAAAKSVSDTVEAVTFGEIGDAAAVLGAHGVTKIHQLSDIGDSLVAPRVSAAIAKAVADGNGPDAVFFATTYMGRDIAARVSARLDAPVLTNIVGLSGTADAITTEHALFGGTQIAKASITGVKPGIYVIRPKSFTPEETGGAAAEIAELAAGDVGTTDGARIVATHSEDRSGPSLDDATVVVSGGRGLGNPDNYKMIEKVAQLVHGAPGASRAIVDAGWVPYAYQVGQTGKTVKPSVYIAFGISGATQHLVGMKNSNRIIAITKDPEAPILKIADLGIVGDALDILPKLISAIEARG